MPKQSTSSAATPAPTASVVAIGRKKCKPFIVNVMIYTPESGYKAEVVLERACTAKNNSLWKFVFDLYKRKASGTEFDQIVHVSYRGLNAIENAAIAGMIDGLTDEQIDELADLHEASKKFSEDPTPENQAIVTKKAQGVVKAGN